MRSAAAAAFPSLTAAAFKAKGGRLFALRALVLVFASLMLVRCSTPAKVSGGGEEDSSLVIQCTILDRNGTLLWSYPATLCIFFPDGRFITAEDRSLSMRDAEAKVIWQKPIVAHHMISLTANGDILVMTSEWQPVAKHKPFFKNLVEAVVPTEKYTVKNKIPADALKYNFRVDKIMRLDSSGKILAEKRLINDSSYPLASLLRDWASMTSENAPTPFEASHLNSIYEIPPNSSSLEAFQSGNILINDTFNQRFFILDPLLKTILWKMEYKGFGYVAVHDVSPLANGHLLLLKNRGHSGEDSSLEEVDPANERVTWRYMNENAGHFRAPRMGSVQLLDDGSLFFAHTSMGVPQAQIIDRAGKPLRTFDLKTHRDVGMQGAYLLPVQSFLRHNRWVSAPKAATVNSSLPSELALDFKPGENYRFEIKSGEVMADTAEAERQIRSRSLLLARYLAKQIDPYRGEATVNSSCALRGEDGRPVTDSSLQMSSSILLRVSKNHAIDCYGDAKNREHDLRQLLYCKSSHTLYELDLYSPASSPAPWQNSIAHCRY